MVYLRFLILFCLVLSHSFAQFASCAESEKTDGVYYFEKHIRPLLASRCFSCHSEASDDLGGSLLLDSRSGWMRGGDLGPAIVPNSPNESLLIQAVRYKNTELQMPPDKPLSAHEIHLLEEWVRMGAPDPRISEKNAQRNNEEEFVIAKQFWAFQSPHAHAVPIPQVANQNWPRNAIDRFVLSKLEEHGLHPVQSADKLSLIRRATFDLTGLPPNAEQIETFLEDNSPDAFANLVDRLLASPLYGQRWGRFWLGVARYADSNGLDENIAHGNAWRYRDYVIRSFNDDKPYDQFVMEQLAGDLLPDSKDFATGRDRTIATGFLSLGPKVLAEVDETKMEMDIIDEQVEAVGRAFLGLTLGCARCHDHKFDPISTEDYYALAGIFKSTKTMEHFTKIAKWNEVVIAPEGTRKRHQLLSGRIVETKKSIEELKASLKESAADCKPGKNGNVVRGQLAQWQQELKRLEASLPILDSTMAVMDHDEPVDLRIHVRGSHLMQSAVVPRGFPSVLVSKESEYQIGKDQSGRLQLAEWLVDGRHPLVARVIVNRVWRWHFGRGIVESTDNFGRLGSRPTNQPLLDWLAHEFVSRGWSIKFLHRLILSSRTYQMSSQLDTTNSGIDEDNQFFWRANLRRLEAEAIRDSVLSVAGTLDLSFEGSLLHVKNREFLFDHTSIDRTKYDSHRRAVYLPVIRNHLYDAFQLFDFTDASVINSNRPTTTVAPQALYMMNSQLVLDASQAFADRILANVGLTTDEKLERAFVLAYGRMPTATEVEKYRMYLDRFQQNDQTTTDAFESKRNAWKMVCHVLMLSNEFIHIN